MEPSSVTKDSYNDKDSRAIALEFFPHLEENENKIGVDFYTGHKNYPDKKFGFDAKNTEMIDIISSIKLWNNKFSIESHIRYLRDFCDKLYDQKIPIIKQIVMIEKKYGINKYGNLFDKDYHFLYDVANDNLISLIKLRKILDQEQICLKIHVNSKKAGNKIDSSSDSWLSAFIKLPKDLKQRCLESKQNLVKTGDFFG